MAKALKAEQFSAENYSPHPLANTVPGSMTTEEFAALCADIKAVGLLQPITLLDGKILDGRARYAACKKVGTVARTVQFSGKDAEAFVISANLHRRTLTALQKALVAARLNVRDNDRISQKDAAARMGVGIVLVNLAVRILKSGNTPLIKRAESGDVTVAEIEEILYDKHTAVAANTAPAAVAADAATVGTPPQHPERRATTTPAHVLTQEFLALDDVNRKAFVDLAWPKLEFYARAKLS